MNTVEKIRVLLVDDHQLMREGMLSLLRQANDISVVGTVSSGEEALNAAFEVNPDVILMDILMKGMTGIETTRWIKEQNPNVKVIIISMEVNREYLSAGIKFGIDGYLPKDSPGKMLIEGVRSVFQGAKFFSEDIKKLVFDEYCEKERMKSSESIKLPNELTKREFEVLCSVATGKTNREIGDELFISVKTVDTHKSHILEKLGLKNTAELVRYAIKNNILAA